MANDVIPFKKLRFCKKITHSSHHIPFENINVLFSPCSIFSFIATYLIYMGNKCTIRNSWMTTKMWHGITVKDNEMLFHYIQHFLFTFNISHPASHRWNFSLRMCTVHTWFPYDLYTFILNSPNLRNSIYRICSVSAALFAWHAQDWL